MTFFRAAVTALFTVAGATCAMAQDITLTSHDGKVEVTGNLLGFDGEFYRVGGHTSVKANVRIIAATHQNLEALVQRGEFREDLFHRLNVIRIHIPKLSERREDIPQLAAFFFAQAAKADLLLQDIRWLDKFCFSTRGAIIMLYLCHPYFLNSLCCGVQRTSGKGRIFFSSSWPCIIFRRFASSVRAKEIFRTHELSRLLNNTPNTPV